MLSISYNKKYEQRKNLPQKHIESQNRLWGKHCWQKSTNTYIKIGSKKAQIKPYN